MCVPLSSLPLQDYLVNILLKEARTEPSEGARYEGALRRPPCALHLRRYVLLVL